MDPAAVTLIQTAFSLGKEILDIVRDGASHEAAASERLAKVETFLTDSIEGIESSILGAAQLVIDKIEADKLEELLSRSRNLSMLVDLQKPEQALQYAMTLRESLDYARNRVQEDKPQWLGPYLGGYAIFLGGLEYCDSCPTSEIEAFETVIEKAKIEILDAATPLLLAEGHGLPWMEVTSFLTNEVPTVPVKIVEVFERAETVPLANPDGPTSVVSLAASSAREWLASEDGVYFSPHVPDRKLSGAGRKLLSKSVDPADELICLIDTTTFGGAADGVAVFDNYMVYADIGEDGTRFNWAELADPPAERSGQIVKAGGKKFNLYDGGRAKAFAKFLNEVCKPS